MSGFSLEFSFYEFWEGLEFRAPAMLCAQLFTREVQSRGVISPEWFSKAKSGSRLLSLVGAGEIGVGKTDFIPLPA
jgi:hypothetical protein